MFMVSLARQFSRLGLSVHTDGGIEVGLFTMEELDKEHQERTRLQLISHKGRMYE
ncbi:hypothetical protein LguiA_030713 [Lonicera macranthoides]